jgi:3-oxoacid CoA-transferase A subunit
LGKTPRRKRKDREMPINKVAKNFDEALADVFDGATILCGGFGGLSGVGGNPSYLLQALASRPVKNLTIVGNAPMLGKASLAGMARTINVPESFADAEVLLNNGQVRKVIASVPALPIMGMHEPFPIVKALQKGQDIEIELVPQGTLAERIRAAKAGIPAFYTPTGAGTAMQEGKESRTFDGVEYLLEHSIKADFAFIWAYKADRYGNLVYKGISRTFNATMAGAATVTIAEVEALAELGDLDPEAVVTPGIYIDRVVLRPPEKA